MAIAEWISVTLDLQWDDEVDVVCTDAGIAGLAGAIAAVDAGAEVLVAGAQASRAPGAEGRTPGWFTSGIRDAETVAYLAELAGDLDAPAIPPPDGDLPIRPAPQAGVATQRSVPPFLGSRLRDWAARCIPSPSGYLYTRVTDWTSTAMQSADGDVIQVAEIGSCEADPGDIVGSVLDWLDAEANTRGLEIQPVLEFERLVFQEGDVSGAVFSTARGPLAIRARHGVLLCRAGPRSGRAPRQAGAGDDTMLRVALVGKAASRFGRVELLTSDPPIGRSAGASTGALENV